MKRVSFAVALLLSAISIQAAAQTPPVVPPQTAATPPVVQKLFRADSKVGFVDLQRIFNESAFGKQGLAQVVALQKSLSDGLGARAREMQALSDRIKAQQSLVAENIVLGWNSDLSRLQREAQFAEQEAQIQVDQLHQKLLATFEDLVRPVIETVRAEKNLWLVFAVQPPQEGGGSLSILAADPAIDLSAEVVSLLNRQSII